MGVGFFIPALINYSRLLRTLEGAPERFKQSFRFKTDGFVLPACSLTNGLQNMGESFDSNVSVRERQDNQSNDRVNTTWSDGRDQTAILNKLFAQPTSSASLENLDTASLYKSFNGDNESATAVLRRYHSDARADRAEKKDGALKTNDTILIKVADASPVQTAATPFRQEEHRVKAGENLDSIARQKLGPNAAAEDIERYKAFVAKVNGLDVENGKVDESKLQGTTLKLPARLANNTLNYQNPANKRETWDLFPDGKSLHHVPLDQQGSYIHECEGPNPQDNYVQTYNHKLNTTVISREAENGDTVKTLYRGKDPEYAEATKVVHPNGDWEMTGGSDSQVQSAEYKADKRMRVEHIKDGSTITTYYDDDNEDKINRTESVHKEGTDTVKTVRTQDGSYSTERTDASGTVTARADRKFFNNGGYNESGTMLKDGKPCSYMEQFDAKTGTTRRTEHVQGTEGNTVTTTTKDGTIIIESADGTKTTTRKDGSEVTEKNGSKISEKPAYDYKNNAELNGARENLNKSVVDNIPADKQAAFKKDMAEFEARAAKQHLSPDEISKVYQSMAKMLNAQDAVVPSHNRALLAESLMHQCAQPQDTHQGFHQTCNVTCVAENTLVKNPSKAVEMACTTAVEGKWTAPDGKVIPIDADSLKPGFEESTYPPTKSGARSFATQVLNVVMINDAFQRRAEPISYQQIKPESAGTKERPDTGERMIDANGDVITDAAGTPLSFPAITDTEIAQVSQRLNGPSGHVIDVGDGKGAVDSVNNENQLRHRLEQFHKQGQFPITLTVDALHWPVTGIERPGFGGHVVTIDGYDPKTGKVHLTNQWGKRSNRWVTIADLYENSSGAVASRNDGSNETGW